MQRFAAVIAFYFLVGGTVLTCQENLYIIDVKQGAVVSDILNLLTQQYGIDFGYNPTLGDRPVRKFGKTEASLPVLLKTYLGPDIEILRQRTDHVLLRQRTANQTVGNRKQFILLDAENRAPVQDVLVYTDAHDQEALSDLTGGFQLDMNESSFSHLIIDRLGYDHVELTYEQLQSTDTIYLDIAPIEVAQIIVNPKPIEHQDLTSTQSETLLLGTGQLPQSTLGISNDLLRSLQNLAGIAAFDDDDTRLSVRGGNWDETLVILDGIPIYRTDHFFGIFGAINGQHAREVTLYRNNFPLEYAGKTAGLVKVTGINKVVDWSGEADVGLLSSSMHLNIPVDNHVQLSLSGRRSHKDLADSDLFEVASGQQRRSRLIRTFPDFNFNDINIRSTIQLTRHGDMSVNYFRSFDHLDNRYSISYPTRIVDRFFTLDEALVQSEEWKNEGLAVNHDVSLGSQSTLSSNLHWTTYRSSGSIKTNVIERENNRPVINEGFSNLQDNNLTSWGGHSKFTTKAKGNPLEIGLAFTHFDNLTRIVQDEKPLLHSLSTSTNVGLFSGYTINFSEGDIQIGGRGDYYSATKSWVFSPRLQGNLSISPKFQLKTSFCVNAQFVRGLTYENRFGQSLDFLVLNNAQRYPLTRSVNTMLGARWLAKAWSIDLELYRKSIDGVAEYSLLLPGFAANGNPTRTRNFHLFLGSGKILGADLQIAYVGKNVRSDLIYTLSKNTNSFPTIQRGRDFLARNDRRHQLKYSTTASWANFSVNATYIFTSGRRYLDLSQIEEGSKRDILTPNSTLPDYHRVDIGLSYTCALGNNKLVLYSTIFNLFNRENVKYLQYVFGIPVSRGNDNTTLRSLVGTETNLLLRTINLGLKFRF